MWFRVELNKDGSVASCAEVEASFKGNRLVMFIEADTKEHALQLGLRRYREYLERQREGMNKRRHERIANGRCRYCNGPLNLLPGEHRKSRCAECSKRELGVRDGKIAPGVRGVPTPSVLANRAQPLVDLTLRRCLDQFDRLTRARFRAWLVAEIERSSEDSPAPRATAAE